MSAEGLVAVTFDFWETLVDVQGARQVGMRTAHYAIAGCVPSPEADLVVSHLADLIDYVGGPGHGD